METVLPSSQPVSAKVRRRGKSYWPRFGLGTMLLGITALCLWLGNEVQKASHQRRVAELIRKHNGWLRYDWQPKETESFFADGPSGPPWLRTVLGDEYFQEIVSVSVNGDWGSKDLQEVFKLRGLQKLYGSGLSDSDLDSIAKMSTLRTISLFGGGVTDAGVQKLVKLPRLECVDLRYSQITADGARQLQAMLPKCDVKLVEQKDQEWAQELFVSYDTDHDGSIADDEWTVLHGERLLQVRFATVDTNQDGKISLLELARWHTRARSRREAIKLARIREFRPQQKFMTEDS